MRCIMGTRFLQACMILLVGGCGDSPSDGELEKDQTVPMAQQWAVRAIEELGGSVVVDEERKQKPVVEVTLWFKKVNDADMHWMSDLPELRTVGLTATAITDRGLAH